MQTKKILFIVLVSCLSYAPYSSFAELIAFGQEIIDKSHIQGIVVPQINDHKYIILIQSPEIQYDGGVILRYKTSHFDCEMNISNEDSKIFAEKGAKSKIWAEKSEEGKIYTRKIAEYINRHNQIDIIAMLSQVGLKECKFIMVK